MSIAIRPDPTKSKGPKIKKVVSILNFILVEDGGGISKAFS